MTFVETKKNIGNRKVRNSQVAKMKTIFSKKKKINSSFFEVLFYFDIKELTLLEMKN
jgi:hypothetical protein